MFRFARTRASEAFISQYSLGTGCGANVVLDGNKIYEQKKIWVILIIFRRAASWLTHTHKHKQKHKTQTNIHTCIHKQTDTYIHKHIQKTYTHIHAHTNTYCTHTNKHTHIHTTPQYTPPPPYTRLGINLFTDSENCLEFKKEKYRKS